MIRFYGGLRREIQHIVDYKEYHSIQRLFHLSMLAEKELQGRQQQRSSTFAPRQPPAPAKASSSSCVRTSTSSAVPSGVVAKPATTTSSTGRSSDIKCHRCQGLVHIQRDCPSKRAYIATGDMVGMLVLLMLKMKILLELTLQRLMMVMKRFLVQQRLRPIRP
jgi:hypothetical protein